MCIISSFLQLTVQYCNVWAWILAITPPMTTDHWRWRDRHRLDRDCCAQFPMATVSVCWNVYYLLTLSLVFDRQNMSVLGVFECHALAENTLLWPYILRCVRRPTDQSATSEVSVLSSNHTHSRWHSIGKECTRGTDDRPAWWSC